MFKQCNYCGHFFLCDNCWHRNNCYFLKAYKENINKERALNNFSKRKHVIKKSIIITN